MAERNDDEEDEEEGAGILDAKPAGSTPRSNLKPEPLSYFAERHEQRWVTLGDYAPMEAQMVRLRLEAEGVRCSLSNEAAALLYSGMFSGVKIEVLEEDLERAREIVKRRPAVEADAEEGDPDPDDGYVDEDWRCPKCHGKHVQYVPLSAPMWLLSLLTVGLAAVLVDRTRYCQDCGHQWK